MLGDGDPPDVHVHVHVASCNTAASTELCIRSMRQHAGHSFRLTVGDSGSTDGSLAMLERLAATGWLELEVVGRRSHAEWLDHWRVAATADLALFVDSDVEFREDGWLLDLVETTVRERAALVYGEMLPEAVNFVEPVGGATVRGAIRPAPWLLMFNVAATAGIEAGFGFDKEVTDRVPEGIVVYDVGGMFFHAALKAGLTCVQMPAGFRRKYHHYGGLSWIPSRGRRGLKKWFDLRQVERRLRRLRRLQGDSVPALPVPVSH